MFVGTSDGTAGLPGCCNGGPATAVCPLAASEAPELADSVEINRDKATVTLFSGAAQQTTPLELVDGGWRIADTSEILFGPSAAQPPPLPQVDQTP